MKIGTWLLAGLMLTAPMYRGHGAYAGPLPTNVRGSDYPRMNPDRSVTFRVQAEHGQMVQVLLEGGRSVYDMVRGDRGYWQVTTKPLLAGFNYYAISVDGFVSNDPGSRVFFAAGKEVSGLEIPGTVSKFFAAEDVLHGSVRTEWYRSETTRETRRIFVYTPPGYDQSDQRYPVLYLQHGFGEDEAGWSEQGHENFILDNLIAAHKAKPMIVVNANGMADMELNPPPPPPAHADAHGPTLSTTVSRFFMEQRYLLFERMLTGELIPYIDANFRTIPDREHRALAGLSMGGAQALQVGLNHMDQFGYIGAFSPAIEITDLRKDFNAALANPETANERLRLLWIGIGSDDFLFAPVKESHDVLERAGIKHVWVESSGEHVWTVWREYLAEFAPRLFQ